MQVLEVGTAVGFSTLLMCEYGQPDMHITTIENYEKRIPIARENFRKSRLVSRRITFSGQETQVQILTDTFGSDMI